MKTVLIEDSARMQFHYPKLESVLGSLVKEKAVIMLFPNLMTDSIRVPMDLKLEFQNGHLTIDLSIIEEIDSQEILIICASRPRKPIISSKMISVICPYEYKEFKPLGLKNLSTELCIMLNELSFKEFYASQPQPPQGVSDNKRKSIGSSRISTKRKNSQVTQTAVDESSFTVPTSTPQQISPQQQQQQLVNQYGMVSSDLKFDFPMPFEAQNAGITGNISFNQQMQQHLTFVWVGQLSWVMGTEQSRMEILCPCKCELATTQYSVQHVQPSNWPNSLVMSQRIFILESNVQKLMTLRNVPIVQFQPSTQDSGNIQSFSNIVNIMTQNGLACCFKFTPSLGMLVCASQRKLVGLVFGQSLSIEEVVKKVDQMQKQQQQQR